MGRGDGPQDPTAAFVVAWGRHFAGEAPAVPASPVFPLARTAPMPEGHPYPCGALGLQWTGVHLHGLGDVAAAERSGAVLNLRLAGVGISGRYRIEAKPDPVCDLDSGGNLMDLGPDATAPAAAGGGTGPVDAAAEQWLDVARDQRTRLGQTEHGLQLIALYNTHNEVYEEVFRTSPTLPGNWRAGGVTRAMAADTSASVQGGTVINPPKDYGGGVTYNGNAFVQQLNVAVETMLSDPNFDPMQPVQDQNLDGKYWEAAKAALSFGKGVSTSTGNTKTSIAPVAPDGVYQAVQTQTALPPVSDAEAKAVLGSATSAGPGAGGPQGGADWIVIDEEDRARVRSIVTRRIRARAEDSAIAGQTLYAGALRAELGAVQARVDLGTGACTVTLPAFVLEIDDAAWAGPTGDLLRQRLAGMQFLRGLFVEAVRDRLAAVCSAAARALVPA